jgi:hypothetical protein
MIKQEYLEKLEEKIDRNSKKLNAIYEILTKKDTSKIDKPSNNNNTTQTKLYPKNIELLESLLDITDNQKTIAFLTSIINNSYPTLTAGQNKVVVDLANQYNVDYGN